MGATNGRVFRTSFSGGVLGRPGGTHHPRANATVSDVLVPADNLNRVWVTYSTIGGGRVSPIR